MTSKPLIVRVVCPQCRGSGSVAVKHQDDDLPTLEVCARCSGRGAINVETQ